MKSHTSLLLGAFALVNVLAVSATAQTYFGEAVAIGDGWLRSYVQYDSGSPSRLGIQMNQAAFDFYGSAPMTATHLSLPSEAPTPFNHVMVDWNPMGHPGPGYDAPHFDFHFYFQSMEEVAAIPFSPFPTPTHPAYVPPDYAGDPVVIPQMGQHYLDLLSPELNGGPFTRTFIYGYYNGALTFLEPMITYATLASGGDWNQSIRQPTNFAIAGYYPAEYGFSLTDGIYDVYLGELSAMPASPVPEPSTYGLGAALGLLALAVYRRKRAATAAKP